MRCVSLDCSHHHLRLLLYVSFTVFSQIECLYNPPRRAAGPSILRQIQFHPISSYTIYHYTINHYTINRLINRLMEKVRRLKTNKMTTAALETKPLIIPERLQTSEATLILQRLNSDSIHHHNEPVSNCPTSERRPF